MLLQVSAGNKTNEIGEAPQLLQGLDLRGKMVAADALHTQRALSVQILASGGEYLWRVKDNQPTLRADIELLFTTDDQSVEGGHMPHDFQTARHMDKGHGRRRLARSPSVANSQTTATGLAWSRSSDWIGSGWRTSGKARAGDRLRPDQPHVSRSLATTTTGTDA